jgi:acetyl-CoA/propionyl-CoA carboxylase biotin carboxyl carrier protein
VELNLRIDDANRRVTVEPDGDSYTVTVDGREYRVTDVTALEGTLAFLVDRESYVAHVSSDKTGARLSMRGRNYRVREETMDADLPGAGAAAGDGRVEAPMPGSIVAVRVSEGDRVTAGTPVVVLESMKMQNEITAPVDGVVKRINCRVGDRVNLTDLLAEITAQEGNT